MLKLSGLVPESLAQHAGYLVERHQGLQFVTYSNVREMVDRIADCGAVIGWNVTAEAVHAAPKLRWVHSLSGGVDELLRIPELRDNPEIVLTNMKIQEGPEMADHAMALLLALTRNLPQFIRNMDSGTWKNNSKLPIIELRGKTMLIIGMGGCGTQVAERAHASGMRVIGTDTKDIPYMGAADYIGKPDELHGLLPEADVVVSCVPFTPETNGLIDVEAFSRMKTGVYVINVSRGAVVKTHALIDSRYVQERFALLVWMWWIQNHYQMTTLFGQCQMSSLLPTLLGSLMEGSRDSEVWRWKTSTALYGIYH